MKRIEPEMDFTPEEIERYQRHLVLRELGGPGQQKLKAARVLVVGAGGLGSPVLAYLAAAGVGVLGIVDNDIVSLSNLQRQIIHETAAVGEAKTASAARAIARINPHVEARQYRERIGPANALELIGEYDIVIDGSDNFATRYLLCDACHLARRPLVHAAIGPLDGQLTLFKSYERDEEGRPNPTYRCLFPQRPEPGAIPNCAEIGVLGAVVGVMGTLAAVEAIKHIAGMGRPLVGRLLLYDALETRFVTINYGWDKTNPLNGEKAAIADLSGHEDDLSGHGKR
jgi:adenylyltransferase/sulfurtransferase